MFYHIFDWFHHWGALGITGKHKETSRPLQLQNRWTERWWDEKKILPDSHNDRKKITFKMECGYGKKQLMMIFSYKLGNQWFWSVRRSFISMEPRQMKLIQPRKYYLAVHSRSRKCSHKIQCFGSRVIPPSYRRYSWLPSQDEPTKGISSPSLFGSLCEPLLTALSRKTTPLQPCDCGATDLPQVGRNEGTLKHDLFFFQRNIFVSLWKS